MRNGKRVMSRKAFWLLPYDSAWLTRLMHCCSQWSIDHTPLNSIQLYLLLLPPLPPSVPTASCPHLFFQIPFPCVPASLCSSVVLQCRAWRSCHHLISVCDQASFIFFFLPAAELVLCQFSPHLFDILSGQCIITIFCRHLLINTCNLLNVFWKSSKRTQICKVRLPLH